MKFLIFVSFLISYQLQAQIDIESLPEIKVPLKHPLSDTWLKGDAPSDNWPIYPGDLEGMYEELSNYIEYPDIAMSAGITGKVIIEFVVDTTGEMTNHKILRGIGGGCDEQVLFAFKSLEHCWVPGTDFKGNPKIFTFRLPVKFDLE